MSSTNFILSERALHLLNIINNLTYPISHNCASLVGIQLAGCWLSMVVGTYNGAVSVIAGAAMLNGTTGGAIVGSTVIVAGGGGVIVLSGAGMDVPGWIWTVASTDMAVVGGWMGVGDALKFIVERSSSRCNANNASGAFSLAMQGLSTPTASPIIACCKQFIDNVKIRVNKYEYSTPSFTECFSYFDLFYSLKKILNRSSVVTK